MILGQPHQLTSYYSQVQKHQKMVCVKKDHQKAKKKKKKRKKKRKKERKKENEENHYKHQKI